MNAIVHLSVLPMKMLIIIILFSYLTGCPDIHNICGKNIDCPNNKVYESCNIKKLLTLKTMTCNDSLQWEHDIDCNASKNIFGVLNVEFKL